MGLRQWFLKRWLVVGVVGVVAFATVWAAAAALTVNSSTLGAGTTTISSCDTNGVDVSYTVSWDSTNKRYAVATASVTNIMDACRGKTISVTVQDSSNVSLGNGSTTVATGTTNVNTTSVTITGSPDASAVANVTVAIG